MDWLTRRQDSSVSGRDINTNNEEILERNNTNNENNDESLHFEEDASIDEGMVRSRYPKNRIQLPEFFINQRS